MPHSTLHPSIHSPTQPRVAPPGDRLHRSTQDAGPRRTFLERRNSPRVAFPAEVAVRWGGPSPFPVLQELVDIGEGGFCLRSGHQLSTGRSGDALTVLPERSHIGRPFVVAWSRQMPDGSFHSGCRFAD